MVLSTRLKDERMAGRVEGRAEGRAAGLEEGRVDAIRNTVLKMLNIKEPLDKILLIYPELTKEDVYALARSNGLEVVE